jgi:hypothetical protein
MTLGVGNIVALICIVISIIFAIVTHQATNALWWALLDPSATMMVIIRTLCAWRRCASF